MGQTKSIIDKTSKIPQYTAKVVLDCNNIHGECPIWDHRKQKLYWIDILNEKFWKYDPVTNESFSHSLPDRPGSFALCHNNDDYVLFAFKNGPRFMDIESFECIGDTLFQFEPNLPTMMTDGRVDRNGRFVVGGYNLLKGDERLQKISNIYRINHDLSHDIIINNIAATNSICFSLNGDKMYYTDSRFTDGQKIIQCDYFNHDDRMPINERVFTKWVDEEKYHNDQNGYHCSIDGSIIDKDGYLWNCEFNGGRVTRYDHDGNINMIINVPEPYVTCCAFGGKDLNVLYITTSSARMKDEEKSQYEQVGALYAIKLADIKGVEESRFVSS